MNVISLYAKKMDGVVAVEMLSNKTMGFITFSYTNTCAGKEMTVTTDTLAKVSTVKFCMTVLSPLTTMLALIIS